MRASSKHERREYARALHNLHNNLKTQVWEHGLIDCLLIPTPGLKFGFRSAFGPPSERESSDFLSDRDSVGYLSVRASAGASSAGTELPCTQGPSAKTLYRKQKRRNQERTPELELKLVANAARRKEKQRWNRDIRQGSSPGM